eukprot:gb/GFBE01052009.1/.p1 GENE.gb/GFBE01052009.1/~~gb/GFBE01052009.1/.p1  ORF type:complete len:642 (+),score=158.26 gb/GFBE01052009.1/:1-1926(+)
MDPIQAWKMQQSRLGTKEKTLQELRNSQPRWTVAFDMADEDQKGSLTQDECAVAFKRILGTSEMPQHKLKELFQELDPLGKNKLDFRQFHKLAADLSQYMTETPKWKQEEERKEEQEEKAQRAKERERKQSNVSDVFSILGISKTKDMADTEARKQEAIVRSKEAAREKLKAAGRKVLESQRLVRRMGALKALGKRTTVQEMSSSSSAAEMRKQEPQEPVSPSGLVAAHAVTRSVSGTTLQRRATIDPSADLGHLRVTGYGAACFALRFSPDDTQLAGGYMDGGLRIFDVDKASHMHTLNVTPRAANSSLPGMAEDPAEAEAIAAAARERKLKNRGAAIMNLRWLPVGRGLNMVATVDTAGTVGFWQLAKDGGVKILCEMAGEYELNGMSFSEDGQKLLVGGQEKMVKVYDVQEMNRSKGRGVKEDMVLGSKVPSLTGRISSHKLKILSIRSMPGNQNIYVSGGLDRSLLMWDLRVPETTVGTLGGVELSGDSLDISRDGYTLLAGNCRLQSPLQLFDLRMLTEAEASAKKTGLSIEPVNSYEWSGEETEKAEEAATSGCCVFQAAWDGFENSIIAACGEKGNMARIYERPKKGEDGPLRIISSLEGRTRAFYSSAVSMDGRNAAFGSADGSVIISKVRSA